MGAAALDAGAPGEVRTEYGSDEECVSEKEADVDEAEQEAQLRGAAAAAVAAAAAPWTGRHAVAEGVGSGSGSRRLLAERFGDDAAGAAGATKADSEEAERRVELTAMPDLSSSNASLTSTPAT